MCRVTRRGLRYIAAIVAVVGLFVAVVSGSANAERLDHGDTSAADENSAIGDSSTTPARPYIATPPPSGRFNILVIGDSLGNGIWAGLARRFGRDEEIGDVIKASRVSTGLVRDDYYDWPAALDELLGKYEVQAAVVLFGTNDKQTIVIDNRHLEVGTEDWRRTYAARVDKVIAKLRARDIAIYWVGLPVMRSASFSRYAEGVNAIVKARTAAAGVKFIDSWRAFADDKGRYDAFGRDERGRRLRMRDSDGIHFTMPGNLRFASFVEEEIRSDVAVATDEAVVPGMGTGTGTGTGTGWGPGPTSTPVPVLRPDYGFVLRGSVELSRQTAAAHE